MSIHLTSPAFGNNDPIPRTYTGEGDNTSPPLLWTSVPEEAKELAILCEDPDAPREDPFVHWLAYGISPTLNGLPQGIGDERPKNPSPIQIKQGQNSWGQTGYGGPMPPVDHGPHRYQFVIYALDVQLKLPEGLTKAEFLRRAAGHMIQTSMLTGIYERRSHEEIA